MFKAQTQSRSVTWCVGLPGLPLARPLSPGEQTGEPFNVSVDAISVKLNMGDDRSRAVVIIACLRRLPLPADSLHYLSSGETLDGRDSDISNN